MLPALRSPGTSIAWGHNNRRRQRRPGIRADSELLKVLLARNGLDHADIISVVFTATDDVHSMFPATAARAIGFGDVPLLCARELDIEGSQPRCIRVLMHVETTRAELHHVYLEGARGLRDDLPE